MLKKYIPQLVKTFLKDYLWVNVNDILDRVSGRRNGSNPPTRLMFDGPIGVNEYASNGQEFIRLFRALIKPSPSNRILDVGSGIGRKTLPLTMYLNKRGSYHGIEIVKKGVDWCKENISKKFPNFHFNHIDIYNGFYNPKGKIQPIDFHFPYTDNFFDVVIATSVFTHMLPEDVKNYHMEIGRVLKKKGKSYLTYFLMNSESVGRLNNDENTMNFRRTKKRFWTTHIDTPEIAIAYEERDVKRSQRAAGLNIVAVHHGSWCGRKNSISYQDIVISSKQ